MGVFFSLCTRLTFSQAFLKRRHSAKTKHGDGATQGYSWEGNNKVLRAPGKLTEQHVRSRLTSLLAQYQ